LAKVLVTSNTSGLDLPIYYRYNDKQRIHFFYIKSKLAKFDYNSFITDILFENVSNKRSMLVKHPIFLRM